MFLIILILAGITALPVFELRGSIPLGILRYSDTVPAWLTITICIITNILITPAVYYIFYGMIRIMCRWERFGNFYTKYSDKVIKKLEPKINKYGIWGLAVFIGIPLPGSGVYSGAVGAHALGMSFKQYLIASIAGVCIAGTAVSAIVLSGSKLFEFLLNKSLL